MSPASLEEADPKGKLPDTDRISSPRLLIHDEPTNDYTPNQDP